MTLFSLLLPVGQSAATCMTAIGSRQTGLLQRPHGVPDTAGSACCSRGATMSNEDTEHVNGRGALSIKSIALSDEVVAHDTTGITGLSDKLQTYVKLVSPDAAGSTCTLVLPRLMTQKTLDHWRTRLMTIRNLILVEQTPVDMTVGLEGIRVMRELHCPYLLPRTGRRAGGALLERGVLADRGSDALDWPDAPSGASPTNESGSGRCKLFNCLSTSHV
ncbi:hypothetical protein CONLIGDRAFT_358473 [Coniochaeta ligniaria NRRL 30616]|uniref:Uncharacterized protein n=1 Tax=Coniochaeta ligniaria NRRL 30616 TaxID=1408157 RepID=A0A1J7JJW4_9PEZI|nr:hypothetical protein CONLIGDRAFT_358473 [Coniochaeta ligniaria NRRL 30616]